MEVLYRKYRPQSFADVKGQEHVIRTLQGALLTQKVGHAYLFCGPRGTGKTTTARLFAKALNCSQLNQFNGLTEPCNVCPSCIEIAQGNSLDLIEIDGASNRNIDDIRNLKESARVASMNSPYKVFLIDEVHMLTSYSFNALLKVLEEPPQHVIFILATTEPHKVLDTILSRVQRFDFHKIIDDDLISKLRLIASKENLQIEEPVYSMLLTASGGSLRDAESLLGTISAVDSKITVTQTAELLGIVPTEAHAKLMGFILKKQTREALEHIQSLHDAGANIESFSKQFIDYLRGQLIHTVSQTGKPEIPAGTLVNLIRSFTNAKQELKLSPIPQLPLELAIIELTSAKTT